MLVFLAQGLFLGGAAAAQPGPFQAYLLAQTLKNGWRRTLLATLAPLISDGPIIVLVVLALTQTPAWLLSLLQGVGGLFLLYLAYKAYRSAQGAAAAQTLTPTIASRQSLWEAALMNALSPNPYIFWSTVAGPILLEGWRRSAGTGLSFLLGFYGALIGGFMGFVALFAVARRLDPRLNRWLSLGSALALLLFGLVQLGLAATALSG